MNFKKYSSIENAYQESFINQIKLQGLALEEFIVQEKVHGANFCFITDGDSIQVGKRSGLIRVDEDFFNYQSILNRYESKVKNLFTDLKNSHGIKTMILFGELFGGGYPHEDVQKDRNAKLVQRGVYYTPHNDFFAFDIYIDSSDYMNVDLSNSLFAKHGFIYAKTLFKGTLSECLEYNNKYQTTIPVEFGLPSIDGNYCEGNIIRSLKNLRLKNGSRVIVKHKNEDWLENNTRVDKKLLSSIFNDGSNISAEVLFLQSEVYRFINENRLNNVISKIGNIDYKKDFGKVLGMFNKDVLEDFVKEYGDRYQKLDKLEVKLVNKFLNKHASEIIVEFFNKKT